MKLQRTLLVALPLVVSAAALSPPASGLETIFDVKAAKKAGGNYKDGVQNASISQGKTKLFYWKVESNSPDTMAMDFDDAATGDSGGDDYKIKWFKGKKPKGTADITSDVKGAGYGFTLKADKTKYFTAQVKPKPGASTLCLGGQASNNPQTFADAVYFSVNGACF